MAQNQLHSQPIRIDRAEWERIKRSANSGLDSIPVDLTNSASRKARSDERVKNWGNTLAASRKKKLEHRKRKEEEAEAARVAVDEEEARIRAQLRKEAIDRANGFVRSPVRRPG